MARRKKRTKREISPDPVYNNVAVAKFINQVMRRGKKTIAQKIVYRAFDIIKEKTKKEPLEVFEKAFENTSPLLEVKPKIRYRHKSVTATIYKILNTKYYILFNKPQRAITPGQSIVFYSGDELLGGGVIC